MSSDLIQSFIPIVAVLAVFGFPVAIVFVLKHFKLKERELAMELESRQKSQQQQHAIEGRVQRLEEVLLSLDHDVRARLGIEQPSVASPTRAELMEGPAGPGVGQAGASDPTRGKVR